MAREKGFLEFNEDNIFVNLLQVENHLQNLDDRDKDHSQCVFKHLSFVSGEASEAISHSSVVKPGKEIFFRKLKSEVDSFRNSVSKMPVKDSILRTRELRKSLEKLDNKFNTALCRACGINNKHNHKELNSESLNMDKGLEFNIISNDDEGENIMANKEKTRRLATFTGSQLAAGMVEQFGLPQIDIMSGMTKELGIPAFSRPSTWIGIFGGLGLAWVGLGRKKGGEVLGLIGTHMAANAITMSAVESMETAPVSRARAFSRVNSRPSVAISSSAPVSRNLGEFPNGSGVIVD